MIGSWNMQVKVITATNPELDRRYAERARQSWQFEHRVYWEHDQLRVWQQWRERNHRLHPEPDFRHTWQRFSHKVEAQCRALREYTAGYLVWLDTDVVQCKPITAGQWREWQPPRGEFCTYLGRGDRYHPETGFICYDLEHPRKEEFVEALATTYLTDRIFTLEQWHDAWVWDWVCRDLRIQRRDIGPGRPGEAFGRSPLKGYLVHCKGPRKQNIPTATTPEALMTKTPKV